MLYALNIVSKAIKKENKINIIQTDDMIKDKYCISDGVKNQCDTFKLFSYYVTRNWEQGLCFASVDPE